MDLERLAGHVAQAQEAKGMSDYRLEHEIGVLEDGSVFNAKQIGRWKQGLRVQPLPRGVVVRLIEILGLDPAETWRLAGLWPEGLDLESYRALSQRPQTPALAQARGGSVPPRQKSLSNTGRPFSQHAKRIMGTCTAQAAQRARQLEDARTRQMAA